jgi:hypothetical protein
MNRRANVRCVRKSQKLLTAVRCVRYVRLMRKKKPQAERRPRAKKAAPVSSEPAAPAAPPAPVVTSTYPLAFDGGPPPEALFHEAESEPDFRSLSQYKDSIRVLRNKRFSYRDIADWLSERGVPADHNSVYRVYTKSLSDYDAHLEAQRVDEEDRDEALRNS